MEISLIRTFLEVAATGSFVNASDRLFITQSAVSLRIQRLETAIGKPLFTRSKAGAELTPAGVAFERYALSLVRIWEEARQQVGVPEGYSKSLTIAARHSLWPRLGFRWIDRMQAAMPILNVRAELDNSAGIMRLLIEGAAQIGLTYTPQLRPGISARKVLDEELVLAASRPMSLDEIGDAYLFVDWGPEFVHAHSLELPKLTNPGLTLALGALAAEYVVNRRAAAYLPARYIKHYLDDRRLFLVPNAPRFPFPVWSIWRDDLDPAVQQVAEAELVAVTTQIEADQETVLADLRDLSGGSPVEVLGNADGGV